MENQDFPETQALRKIIAWANEKLSPWQHELLRYFFASCGVMGERKFFRENCFEKLINIVENEEEVEPLSEQDISPSKFSICLKSIGPLQNVKDLAENQVLEFETGPGLNIVYGENGSGKSSYVDVLDQTRAPSSYPEDGGAIYFLFRSPEKNVFKYSETAQAKLTFLFNDREVFANFSFKEKGGLNWTLTEKEDSGPSKGTIGERQFIESQNMINRIKIFNNRMMWLYVGTSTKKSELDELFYKNFFGASLNYTLGSFMGECLNTIPKEFSKIISDLHQLSLTASKEEKSKMEQKIQRLTKELDKLQDLTGTKKSEDTKTSSKNVILEKCTEIFKYFIEGWNEKFLAELKAFGLNNLEKLGIKFKSIEDGHHIPYHILSLDEQLSSVKNNPKFNPLNIPSEGETRAVALAAFFAELAVSENHSAAVFDDPVSSLSQNYRQLVASRIVEEAQKRQVIVFTHDLVFLHDLKRELEARDQEMKSSFTISRTEHFAGVCTKGLPFRMKSLKGAIGDFEEAIEKEYTEKSGTDEKEKYLMGIKKIGYCTRFRQLCEMAVEEVVGVFKRLDEKMLFGELKNLTVLSNEHYEEIHKLYKKYSKFIHLPPIPQGENLPDKSEVLKDIGALRKWVDKIRGLKDEKNKRKNT